MKKNELRAIYEAIWNAKAAIQHLACDDYPYTEFRDGDLRDMFYALNSMCVKLTDKMRG